MALMQCNQLWYILHYEHNRIAFVELFQAAIQNKKVISKSST